MYSTVYVQYMYTVQYMYSTVLYMCSICKVLYMYTVQYCICTVCLQYMYSTLYSICTVCLLSKIFSLSLLGHEELAEFLFLQFLSLSWAKLFFKLFAKLPLTLYTRNLYIVCYSKETYETATLSQTNFSIGLLWREFCTLANWLLHSVTMKILIVWKMSIYTVYMCLVRTKREIFSLNKVYCKFLNCIKIYMCKSVCCVFVTKCIA